MLIPLSRKKFEELIPPLATAQQYKYCWGGPSDILRRVLFSLAGLLGAAALQQLVTEFFQFFTFLAIVVSGTYWLWAPIYFARRRSRELRRYGFAGFLRGEVLGKFITEELIGSEEKVNRQGELMIIENRERRLNLELGDETGFSAKLQVPLEREHRAIRQGDWVEVIVVSNRSDLSRIAKISDAYLPDSGFWISDYPYVRRDVFREVSRSLERRWREPEVEYQPRDDSPRGEHPRRDDDRLRDDYPRRAGDLPRDGY
ncbi:MAG: phosphate ABC transporter permease [Elainellaceae cyanobacterium]